MMFKMVLSEDRFAAAVIARVTYDIQSGNAFPKEQPLVPLSGEVRESQFGPLESDFVFRRGGVDIFVFGNAIAPNEKPTAQMKVEVRVGNRIAHQLWVFGDRFWKDNIMGGLSISNPKPFVKMPLSLFNSFGGKAEWDGLEIPYPSNPYGKGFYWTKEEASGKPLPNVEAPDQLVQSWKDRPDPAGFVQVPLGGVRMKGNVEHEKGTITKISPKIFNAAFPQMIAEEINPGEQIIVKGMSPKKDFSFTVPKHELFTEIKLGENISERPLKIDQIGIFPELKKVFITYRFPFRYKFTPMQKRECVLFER